MPQRTRLHWGHIRWVRLLESIPVCISLEISRGSPGVSNHFSGKNFRIILHYLDNSLHTQLLNVALRFSMMLDSFNICLDFVTVDTCYGFPQLIDFGQFDCHFRYFYISYTCTNLISRFYFGKLNGQLGSVRVSKGQLGQIFVKNDLI